MLQDSLTGIEPPITQDPDYPEMLRELAEVAERELCNVGIDPTHAAAVAETLAEHVRERFGGTPVYWAKGESMRQRRRRARMWDEFNGRNHAELSRRYGICLQQVYRSLAISKAETAARLQRGLFEAEAGEGKA